jgi:hypothetical protein
MTPEAMLVEIFVWCDSHEEEDVVARQVPEAAFRDIANRGLSPSEKQVAWIKSVYEKLFDTPIYENAWSSGKVARGAALATPVPEVLKKPLPLRPPGRAR